MGGIGPPELLIVLAIVLLLFGASKLPKLARSMGEASREFRQGAAGKAPKMEVAGPCPFCGIDVPKDAQFCPGCAKSASDIVDAKAKGQTASRSSEKS